MKWLVLLGGAWLAATVSGAAGFGGALLLLPALTYSVGAKAAVPMLTLAQLLGNLSRAGFGFREIRWRPALLFSAGALPASVAGAMLFVGLPVSLTMRLIGIFLLLMIGLRHTPLGKREFPLGLFFPSGALVGFLSGMVGSAGPLGAALFLGLHLPPTAYVATEAVTAVFMHSTKSLVYGRYAALTISDLILGLAMGGAMAIGSWTGRKVIERLPKHWFGIFVEVLLALSALSLLV